MADEKPDDTIKRSDLEGFLASFVAKHGGSERRALEVLGDETLVLRRKNQRYKERAEEAEKKLPPEGARVLTADEAKRFEAFEALKVSPEDAAKGLEERETLRTTLAERERDATVRSAAEVLGFKPTVLADLVQTKKLHVELKDVTVEEKGKKRTEKQPHVRPADDEKAALVPLAKYAEDHLTDYLPALRSERRAGPAATGDYPLQRTTRSTAPSSPDGEELVKQKAATGAYSAL